MTVSASLGVPPRLTEFAAVPLPAPVLEVLVSAVPVGVRPRRRIVVTLALVVAVSASFLAPALAAPPKVPSFGAEIDPYARYEGQSRCEAKEQPGVAAFRDLVTAAYPGTGRGGIVRNCSSGGRSEHKEGRAWDWMVHVNNPQQRAAADELLAWLLATDEHGNEHAMARRFGVMYIIWNRQVWNAYRPHEGWRPYTGANPHIDHVHFSFSWDGALQRTSFWTYATEPGPFPDIPKHSALADSVTWLVDTGITQGRGDGRYDPSSNVTRGQMALFLYRLMDEPTGAPPVSFPDVAPTGEQARAIAWLADAGITKGYTSGSFGPGDPVTRGQMALFLWRTLGTPNGTPPHSFVDIAPASEQNDALSWLSAHGIANGVTATRYNPSPGVTRGQMALFLHRLGTTHPAWSAASVLPTALGR